MQNDYKDTNEGYAFFKTRKLKFELNLMCVVASCSVIVSKLDEQTFVSEFDSHWMLCVKLSFVKDFIVFHIGGFYLSAPFLFKYIKKHILELFLLR